MLHWPGLGHLFCQRLRQANDRRRSLRQPQRIGRMILRRLMHQRPARRPRSDIRQGMRPMRRVHQVAQQHHVDDRPGQRNTMRLQRPQNRLQIVYQLRQRRIGQRLLHPRRIERNLQSRIRRHRQPQHTPRIFQRFRNDNSLQLRRRAEQRHRLRRRRLNLLAASTATSSARARESSKIATASPAVP